MYLANNVFDILRLYGPTQLLSHKLEEQKHKYNKYFKTKLCFTAIFSTAKYTNIYIHIGFNR